MRKPNMPPVGHIVSIVLEELSRAGKEISLEQLLEGWNKIINRGNWYYKVSLENFTESVNDLQLNRLGILLGIWGCPWIYQKILSEVWEEK